MNESFLNSPSWNLFHTSSNAHNILVQWETSGRSEKSSTFAMMHHAVTAIQFHLAWVSLVSVKHAGMILQLCCIIGQLTLSWALNKNSIPVAVTKLWDVRSPYLFPSMQWKKESLSQSITKIYMIIYQLWQSNSGSQKLNLRGVPGPLQKGSGNGLFAAKCDELILSMNTYLCPLINESSCLSGPTWMVSLQVQDMHEDSWPHLIKPHMTQSQMYFCTGC